MDSRSIAIAGGGIAGLAAGLCLAARGFTVTIHERAERLEEVGAGLQLSPNATRILARLGVVERLNAAAVRPSGVVLTDAASLRQLARMPLGAAAERRWGAPYLVAHRADLQAALIAQVRTTAAIRLELGTEVASAELTPEGAMLVLEDAGGRRRETACDLLIGADGVWSRLRALAGGPASRFTGYVAFRTVVEAGEAAARTLAGDAVTAFLSPRFHLVAYPLRGGAAFNLVLVTRGAQTPRGWATPADASHPAQAVRGAAPALSRLVGMAGDWTAWPLNEVPQGGRWTMNGRLVLIGDAAHALTPHAAQGAAMAIEDAAALAHCLAAEEQATALATFERLRKPRLARVARRGDLNRLAWHAGGVTALARNLLFRLRSGESLAADLDWLYGHDAAGRR